MKLIQYLKKNKHLLLISYVVVYIIWFIIVEHLVTDDYWVSYIPLDDKIPFVDWFVIFYSMWYFFLIVPGLYLLVKKDIPAFKRYMWFIIIGFSVSLFICTVFPNGQNLRPAEFEHDNVFTWAISRIYAADTNTNVLPSMHVVGCIAVVTAVFDSSYTKRWRIPVSVLAVLICLSTVFIKQHSVLDVIAGVIVCIPIWLVLYLKRVKKRREWDGGKKEEEILEGNQTQL